MQLMVQLDDVALADVIVAPSMQVKEGSSSINIDNHDFYHSNWDGLNAAIFLRFEDADERNCDKEQISSEI